MDFIKDDERVFVEELGTVDQSLKENSVGHEEDFRVVSDEGLHCNVVTHCSLLWDLIWEELVEVLHCKSSRLDTNYFSIKFCLSDVLVK